MEKRRLRGKRSPSTLGSPGVGVSAAQTDAGVSPFESPCDTPAVGTPEHDVASPVVDEAQSSDAPVPAVKRKYKHDLVGAILDVTYTGDESGTFRVEVIKYDQPTGWHHVNSTGLSEWDGESFTDLIDINSMACEGLIRQAGWRHPITKDSNHQHGSAGRGRGKPKKAAVPPAMKECLEFQKKSPEHAGAALQMKKDKLKDHKKSVTSKNGPSGSSSVDAALLGMMLDIRYPGEKKASRVRVVRYLPEFGKYLVDSEGLSTWGGESFTDEVNIGDMLAKGKAELVRDTREVKSKGHRHDSVQESKSSTGKQRTEKATRAFAGEIIGSLVDMVYGARTCRMQVESLDKKNGWHTLDSAGHSTWGGHPFKDVVDVGQLVAEGKLSFIPPDSPEAADGNTSHGAGGKGRRGGRAARGNDSRVKRASTGGAAAGSQATRSPSLAPASPANSAPKGGGTGAPGDGQHKTSAPRRPASPPVQQMGHELRGTLMDLTFTDPSPRTVRVRVGSFDESTGFHQVVALDAGGQQGQAMVDLNGMHASGLAQFINTMPPELDVGIEQNPGRGRGRGRFMAKYPITPNDRSDEPKIPRHLGVEICGRTVDITYTDPPEKYRVQVVGFDSKSGWHSVDSKGLSSWDGEDFQDEVDLNSMLAAGQLEFVESHAEGHPPGNAVGKRNRRAKGRQARTVNPKPASPEEHGHDTPSQEAPVQQPPQKRRRSAIGSSGGSGLSEASKLVDSGFGHELIGRIVDIGDATSAHRVAVTSYDETNGLHRVETFGNIAEGSEMIEDLDLNALHRTGQVTFVDGQDELRKWGHALVNEEITFIPTGVAMEAGDPKAPDSCEAWVKATIVGWWPQELLPPVATARGNGGAREAVFVAQDASEDRWQIVIGDALLAIGGRLTGNAARPSLRVLEVFAGSCELSLALLRRGVDAEPYDILLSSSNDFVTDESFLKRVTEEPPYDLVHFSPPSQFKRNSDATCVKEALGSAAVDSNARAMLNELNENQHALAINKMFGALMVLHGKNIGFVVESTIESPLWRHAGMESVAKLDKVEHIMLDMHSFGYHSSWPVKLLTNRGRWFAPLAVASAQASAKAESSGQNLTESRSIAVPSHLAAAPSTRQTSEPERHGIQEMLRYPKKFCEMYANELISAAASATHNKNA